jgi:redox-sensitive bicupin YhaK (pirin superfamily)
MLDLVIEARRRDLGGFEVGRVLPFAKRRMVGPFVFFDHMGPVTLPPNVPRTTDVRPHPHIGLSTVTYLFAGEITHRDSTGVEQRIQPGAVNWMTAGRAISHSERFDGLRRTGGEVHGIQAWVALPDADEETDPAFFHHPAGDLPTFGERGVSARLIVGSAFRMRNPVKTHSPMFYVHANLAAGASIATPNEYAEEAAYVAVGRVECDGHAYGAGHMLVFGAGQGAALRATEPSTVMLLGGEPLGRRHIWWNFVSSRDERIAQAAADWKAGRIPLPPLDNQEFIPLPEQQFKPEPEPMS